MTEEEYTVLYTGQKTKKAKTWHDGTLKLLSSGTKAVLYDDKNARIDSVYVRVADVVLGEQIESDRFLILIEEKKSSQSPVQPTSASCGQSVGVRGHPPGSKNQPAAGQVVRSGTAGGGYRGGGLKRKITGFVPPRMLAATQQMPAEVDPAPTLPAGPGSVSPLQGFSSYQASRSRVYCRQQAPALTHQGQGSKCEGQEVSDSGLRLQAGDVGNKLKKLFSTHQSQSSNPEPRPQSGAVGSKIMNLSSSRQSSYSEHLGHQQTESEASSNYSLQFPSGNEKSMTIFSRNPHQSTDPNHHSNTEGSNSRLSLPTSGNSKLMRLFSRNPQIQTDVQNSNSDSGLRFPSESRTNPGVSLPSTDDDTNVSPQLTSFLSKLKSGNRESPGTQGKKSPWTTVGPSKPNFSPSLSDFGSQSSEGNGPRINDMSSSSNSGLEAERTYDQFVTMERDVSSNVSGEKTCSLPQQISDVQISSVKRTANQIMALLKNKSSTGVPENTSSERMIATVSRNKECNKVPDMASNSASKRNDLQQTDYTLQHVPDASRVSSQSPLPSQSLSVFDQEKSPDQEGHKINVTKKNELSDKEEVIHNETEEFGCTEEDVLDALNSSDATFDINFSPLSHVSLSDEEQENFRSERKLNENDNNRDVMTENEQSDPQEFDNKSVSQTCVKEFCENISKCTVESFDELSDKRACDLDSEDNTFPEKVTTPVPRPSGVSQEQFGQLMLTTDFPSSFGSEWSDGENMNVENIHPDQGSLDQISTTGKEEDQCSQPQEQHFSDLNDNVGKPTEKLNNEMENLDKFLSVDSSQTDLSQTQVRPSNYVSTPTTEANSLPLPSSQTLTSNVTSSSTSFSTLKEEHKKSGSPSMTFSVDSTPKTEHPVYPVLSPANTENPVIVSQKEEYQLVTKNDLSSSVQTLGTIVSTVTSSVEDCTVTKEQTPSTTVYNPLNHLQLSPDSYDFNSSLSQFSQTGFLGTLSAAASNKDRGVSLTARSAFDDSPKIVTNMGTVQEKVTEIETDTVNLSSVPKDGKERNSVPTSQDSDMYNNNDLLKEIKETVHTDIIDINMSHSDLVQYHSEELINRTKLSKMNGVQNPCVKELKLAGNNLSPSSSIISPKLQEQMYTDDFDDGFTQEAMSFPFPDTPNINSTDLQTSQSSLPLKPSFFSTDSQSPGVLKTSENPMFQSSEDSLVSADGYFKSTSSRDIQQSTQREYLTSDSLIQVPIIPGQFQMLKSLGSASGVPEGPRRRKEPHYRVDQESPDVSRAGPHAVEPVEADMLARRSWINEHNHNSDIPKEFRKGKWMVDDSQDLLRKQQNMDQFESRGEFGRQERSDISLSTRTTTRQFMDTVDSSLTEELHNIPYEQSNEKNLLILPHPNKLWGEGAKNSSVKEEEKEDKNIGEVAAQHLQQYTLTGMVASNVVRRSENSSIKPDVVGRATRSVNKAPVSTQAVGRAIRNNQLTSNRYQKTANTMNGDQSPVEHWKIQDYAFSRNTRPFADNQLYESENSEEYHSRTKHQKRDYYGGLSFEHQTYNGADVDADLSAKEILRKDESYRQNCKDVFGELSAKEMLRKDEAYLQKPHKVRSAPMGWPTDAESPPIRGMLKEEGSEEGWVVCDRQSSSSTAGSRVLETNKHLPQEPLQKLQADYSSQEDTDENFYVDWNEGKPKFVPKALIPTRQGQMNTASQRVPVYSEVLTLRHTDLGTCGLQTVPKFTISPLRSEHGTNKLTSRPVRRPLKTDPEEELALNHTENADSEGCSDPRTRNIEINSSNQLYNLGDESLSDLSVLDGSVCDRFEQALQPSQLRQPTNELKEDYESDRINSDTGSRYIPSEPPQLRLSANELSQNQVRHTHTLSHFNTSEPQEPRPLGPNTNRTNTMSRFDPSMSSQLRLPSTEQEQGFDQVGEPQSDCYRYRGSARWQMNRSGQGDVNKDRDKENREQQNRFQWGRYLKQKMSTPGGQEEQNGGSSKWGKFLKMDEGPPVTGHKLESQCSSLDRNGFYGGNASQFNDAVDQDCGSHQGRRVTSAGDGSVYCNYEPQRTSSDHNVRSFQRKTSDINSRTVKDFGDSKWNRFSRFDEDIAKCQSDYQSKQNALEIHDKTGESRVGSFNTGLNSTCDNFFGGSTVQSSSIQTNQRTEEEHQVYEIDDADFDDSFDNGFSTNQTSQDQNPHQNHQSRRQQTLPHRHSPISRGDSQEVSQSETEVKTLSSKFTKPRFVNASPSVGDSTPGLHKKTNVPFPTPNPAERTDLEDSSAISSTKSGQFKTPVMKNFSISVLHGSQRNLCGELMFPSGGEVESNVTPARQVTIPVRFPTVQTYKQTIAAALREHLNIILFDLSRQFHRGLDKVDVSGYSGHDKSKKSLSSKSCNPPCKCGTPSKMVQVRKEGPNKGRFFYACEAPRNQQCKFFQWMDQPSKGGKPGCTAVSRATLNSADSITAYIRGNGVTFYCECQLVFKQRDNFNKSKFKKGIPAWVRQQEQLEAPKKCMYVRLSKRDVSSYYSRDDIWVVSQSLLFEPGTTFIAKSCYFGPNSNNEVEIEPISGYSPSNWSNNCDCHAILVGNASMELVCLVNLEEFVNITCLPILPHLLDRSTPGERKMVNKSTTKLCTPGPFVTQLAEDYVLRYKLNVDQTEAVMRVAAMMNKDEDDSDPVMLIHGVFGAGKSFLLSVLIRFLVDVFQKNDTYTPDVPYPWKLLISSTTNVAVDRVLMGLLDLGFEDFIRVGSVKKIAKPVLPYSVHASGSDSQELKDLQEMLRSDIPPSEKQLVRRSIEKHRLGENKKKLGGVRVVGVTCAACSFNCLNNIHFPFVVLDECSQMTEPASMLPVARFRCEKLILVGDPKQLDPTIQGSEPGHREGLEQTLFDRMTKLEYSPVLLRTQYRCHPWISHISNSLFYSGQLQDGVTLEDRPPLTPLFPTLCFYDVSGGEEATDGSGSYYNTAEANLVVKLIHGLVLEGVEARCVGVITLYKAQMYKIITSLHTDDASMNKELKAVQVSTVDAFQGGERDVIILSCVRSNNFGFIDNDKRTNVALTRARHHLLIVGHQKNLSRNKLWSRVIHNCRDRPRGVQCSRSILTEVQALIDERRASEASSQETNSGQRKKRGGKRKRRKKDEDSPPMSLSGELVSSGDSVQVISQGADRDVTPGEAGNTVELGIDDDFVPDKPSRTTCEETHQARKRPRRSELLDPSVFMAGYSDSDDDDLPSFV